MEPPEILVVKFVEGYWSWRRDLEVNVLPEWKESVRSYRRKRSEPNLQPEEWSYYFRDIKLPVRNLVFEVVFLAEFQIEAALDEPLR